FPLAVAQHEAVAGSVLVPFKNSGHGLFYDEREKFNRELARFLGLS
ncbi:MAG TPA: alpha/beta hydrolase, partial [Ruminococcaceae bacterium]|nr:alpha/beta hydrolase [Oscillospiraceae bacterium]